MFKLFQFRRILVRFIAIVGGVEAHFLRCGRYDAKSKNSNGRKASLLIDLYCIKILISDFIMCVFIMQAGKCCNFSKTKEK